MNTKQDLIDLLSRPDVEIDHFSMSNETREFPNDGASTHIKPTGRSTITIVINRIKPESKEPNTRVK